MSETKKNDIATFLGTSPDGNMTLLRATSQGLVIDSCKKLVEGQSIQQGQEVVHLSQIGDKNLYDVNVLHEGSPVRSGPVNVSTKAYRDGYDRIFGNSKGSSASN